MNNLGKIKKQLEEIKPEIIKKYHVESIGLFGSVVRNDFLPESDIDIIVAFTKPVGIEFIDLADFIEKKLAQKIDLVSKNGIKEKYFKSIEDDIVYV